MKIAIVEDDKDLAFEMWRKLKRSWYTVVLSNSIWEFKNKVLDHADLFIIDLDLWDWHWLEVVKWLRKEKKTDKPILISTWNNDSNMKVKLLNIWADDYICKPVIPEELLARVSALLRRWKNFTNSIVTYKDLNFDFDLREAYKNWEKLDLSRKELQIIELFLLNKWKVVKKDELIQSVWWNLDLLDVSHNTVNVTVCRIRNKLWNSFSLDTISWVGYILK